MHSNSELDAELLNPTDFTSFDIINEAGSVDSLNQLGKVSADGMHVFVDLDIVNRLAGDLGDDGDWLSGLQKMVEYADAHGWVDQSRRVRAHVVSDS